MNISNIMRGKRVKNLQITVGAAKTMVGENRQEALPILIH